MVNAFTTVPRCTRTRTSLPIGVVVMRRCTPAPLRPLTETSSTSVTRSPTRKPAFAAGLFGSTIVMDGGVLRQSNAMPIEPGERDREQLDVRATASREI